MPTKYYKKNQRKRFGKKHEKSPRKTLNYREVIKLFLKIKNKD